MSQPVVHSFDTPVPVHLYVENGSGSVVITTSDRTGTEVRVSGARAADATVLQEGDRVSVIAPKNRAGFFGGDHELRIEINAADGGHLVVKSGSASVQTIGRLDTLRVKSGSGDVAVDQVDGVAVVGTGSGDLRVAVAGSDLKVRSGSGDVAVGRSGAAASLSSGSGDIKIGHAQGPVVVKTGSGDLDIGEADDDVAITTGSGDLTVGAACRGKLTAKGASGDIRVGVPAGIPVWTEVSTITGRITSTLPSVGEPEPGADYVELRATTVSGNIALVPA